MLRVALLLLLASPALADPALVAAARGQVGVGISHDPARTALAYPKGDVDRTRGVCTDVVIRALRDSYGIDLQRAVHRDMARAFSAYPKTWGLKRTGRYIDHRRVGNLATLRPASAQRRRRGRAPRISSPATSSCNAARQPAPHRHRLGPAQRRRPAPP